MWNHRPVPARSSGCDEGATTRPPPVRTGRRAIEVAALAAGSGVVMVAVESVKQWLHPAITIWQSHAVTITLSSMVAAYVGYVVLRRGDWLRQRLVDEAEARQRAAEEAARASSLLLATLESNRDGVLVVSLDGTVLTFNHQFLDMWQLPESVVLGPTRDLLRRAEAQLIQPDALGSSVRRFQTDTEAESTEVLAFKDGRTVELFTAPQRLNGVVVGRVWRSRDITAHRQAQQYIHMLAQTIRSVGECVSVTDMDDRVLFVNQAFLDTYGFEESDLVGNLIALVRSPRTDADVARQILPATLRGGWSGELWNRRKDGTDFQVYLSTSIVRDEAGAAVALVGVARDITEQKRTEEALRRGRESERIVTLASGIAHQFNNLMQNVLGNTALALEELPPESGARGSLQLVLHASERAANLTGQLLAFAGRGVFMRVETVDVNQEIRERAAFLAALMPPASTLDFDLSEGPATVQADREQIRQVLTSLVTNAAEAMANRPGRASVGTRIEDVTASDARPWVAGGRAAPGRYVCLSVSDQGVGMDAETISHIFDPFFSTKFLGRGMGLPAVLGIARTAGGAVAVDSTPGRGTSVTVAFPVHSPD